MIVEFANKVSIDSSKMRKQLKAVIEIAEPIYSNDGTENQKRLLKEVTENYNWFVQNEPIDFGDKEIIFEWLKIADNKKNQGLYVGQHSTGWNSPSQITRESFEQEKMYTMNLLQYSNWCLATLQRRMDIQKENQQN